MTLSLIDHRRHVSRVSKVLHDVREELACFIDLLHLLSTFRSLRSPG